MRNIPALFTLLIITAVAPLAGDDNLALMREHNLAILKNAASPQKIRLLRSVTREGEQHVVPGILFTLDSRHSERVAIAGNFTRWQPRAMKRSRNGIWYFFLPSEAQSEDISYKYLIDGVWTHDTTNPFTREDGYGSILSETRTQGIPEGRQVTFRVTKSGAIQFRIYRPDARFISVVGDFNNWNPENDLLVKGEDGIWRLTRRLPMGTYRYRYIIDGNFKPDMYNPLSSSDENGQVCSLIHVK